MALASEIQTMMAAELQHFAAIVAGGHMDTTNSTLELIRRLGFDGALDYVANATRPYTPADILDELAGIAHGSGVDEQLLLRVHMFPELMQASCSLIFSHGAARAAVDGSLLAVRALDWDVSGVLQNFPLLLVYHRDPSTAGEEPRVFATLGWAGFVGGSKLPRLLGCCSDGTDACTRSHGPQLPGPGHRRDRRRLCVLQLRCIQ